MKLSYSWPLLLFVLLFGFSSCEKDEDDDHDHDHAEVSINILSPTNDSTVTDPSQTHIHVQVTSDEDLHDIYVYLQVEGDSSYIAPFGPMTVHEHATTVDIEEDIDLSSYPAGTEFHLEVEACEDHDCEEKETQHIHFSI
ncbi:hypothetical protein PPO43_04995 [Saprospira sp. CCB-QB6]|uniref:hypothetical protein n=1 Tax=Saprospira sp. CCB-QB6 TaxID=3023936 RepID=UPI002349846F|nr:hypothetical protein [Saprospira sp. CCB-QB6]WCL82455.1 hypothetical protein PPO43_04995 [Saprospira sp. CCB-QB6]